MSIMNNHLLTATGSFGLESAYSMVEKAAREYKRCTMAKSNDDRRDAAINCAITLWHLNDWVWNGIAQHSRDKAELKDLLGVTGRRAEKDDLVRWATQSCPELNLCQSICNGSKHVVCIGIKEARMTPNGGEILDTLEIVYANGVSDGIEVLRNALDFWYYHATNDNILC